MKQAAFLKLLLIAAVACTAAVGCKRNPKQLTYIPGQSGSIGGPSPLEGGNTLGPGGIGSTDMTTSGLPPAGRDRINWLLDPNNGEQVREFFAAQTVYFDFDSSVVKPEDIGKIETVAAHMRSNSDQVVIVEGHCDERGTEEYNRALGERRALSVREALVRAGASADQIHTISFGEDVPAVDGQNEAAWSQNRRGEFVLVRPKN
ncbi:MAG TPA: peptidoglycan-associated lipoprotein [Verrucomicrobiales bacterium]|nr:peptidoglycan-associated lipoprotein [Verrucomicrobiales bacterium]